MNKDNAKQYLPLVQALVDGKTIQIDALLNGNWKEHVGKDGFSFRLPPEYYRVKPETEVLYVVYTAEGIYFRTVWEEWLANNTAEYIKGSYKKFVEVT